jgi:hypothetical protein
MGVHGAVKSTYLAVQRFRSENPLADYKWLFEQEFDSWKYWVDLPLNRLQWLWRRGFTSPCGKLYDFETYGPDA